MPQFTGVAELDGLFKVVYPENYIKAVPEQGLFTRLVPFEKRDREGKSYNVQVVLAYSHGFTYNTTSGSAYTLNNSIAMSTDEASVEGAEITLRDAISYRALAKSAGGNKVAFKSATEQVVDNMLESMTKRLELEMIYGGVGVGVGDSSVNVNTTTTDVTLTVASWATGIWAGMENAEIQFYNIPADTLVSSGADSIFTITRVTPSSRQLRVTGTTTGISALDTALAANDCNIYFRGSKAEQMTGMVSILTTSGSLFGINNQTYNLWRANTYSAGSAQLTMQKVLAAAADASARGLSGKATLVCNPLTWQNLANDLAALRRFDGSYKRGKGDTGFEALTYYGQSYEIEIIGYNLIKQGEAMLLPMDEVKRLGAMDITFNPPGSSERTFFELPDRAGVELRCYADQAIFLNKPATAVYFNNIVNVG